MAAMKISASFDTFIYKFFVPILLVAVLPITLFADISALEGGAISDSERIQRVIILLGLLAAWMRYLWPLKNVTLGDDGLRLSNHFRGICVPYDNIRDVKPVAGDGFVEVEFKSSTAFGDKIVFLPRKKKKESGQLFVVTQLRRRARLDPAKRKD